MENAAYCVTCFRQKNTSLSRNRQDTSTIQDRKRKYISSESCINIIIIIDVPITDISKSIFISISISIGILHHVMSRHLAGSTLVAPGTGRQLHPLDPYQNQGVGVAVIAVLDDSHTRDVADALDAYQALQGLLQEAQHRLQSLGSIMKCMSLVRVASLSITI
jgi:hypothetical protein